MNEVEWLICTSSKTMMDFLQGKVGDRKLRLFACACCRRVAHLMPDRRCRKALEASEKYADGLITEIQLEWADRRTWGLFGQGGHGRGLSAESDLVGHKVAVMTQGASKLNLSYHLAGITRNLMQVMQAADGSTQMEGESWLSNSLRCAIGNPFRALNANPAWLTPHVLTLAQTIYEDRAFDRIPALGDALEAAGCDEADVLAHCRSLAEHLRGCWVVDGLLGKN